jgi:hypothetical protein
MKSAEFIDAGLEGEMNENGFVHIKNFLGKDVVTELLNLFKSQYYFDGQPNVMWNSLYNVDPAKSAEISEKILAIVKPHINAAFKNAVCPVATFMVKNPTFESTVTLHRDFTVQDEREFSYRNIWIPLIDTTPEIGALYALKYSHAFFDYPLPHHTKWPYMEYEEMLAKHCDVILANAGDLVMYGDRMLHGSFNNKTSEPRPVVHFGLLHPESQLCYYYLNSADKQVTVYEVPYKFFFENNWANQDGRFPIRHKFKFDPPAYTKDEILRGLKITAESQYS